MSTEREPFRLKVAVTGPKRLIEQFIMTLNWKVEKLHWENDELCIFNTIVSLALEPLFELVESQENVSRQQLTDPKHKKPSIVKARDLFLFCAYHYFGLSHCAASRMLGFSSHASTVIACRAFGKNLPSRNRSLEHYYMLMKTKYDRKRKNKKENTARNLPHPCRTGGVNGCP